MQRLIIGGLALLGVAAAFVFLILFKQYHMPTGSMAPTMPIGSRVLMGRFARDFVRGDLVVFDYPLQPDVQFVKRVVGLPCDTIEIRERQLFVNGVRAVEPYVRHTDDQVYPGLASLPEPYRSRDRFGPYRVPPASYFVLGDNRDESADSRFWGTVPAENMRGRIVLVINRDGIRRPPRPPVLASLPACRSITFAPPATPATTPAR